MSIGSAKKNDPESCCKQYFFRILLLVLGGLALGVSSAKGQQPKRPGNTGERIVLTVSWADGRMAPAKFALKDLEKLERKDYLTVLPSALSVPGRHDWQGIPLRAVLQAAGALHPSSLRIVALDGYQVIVPITDVERFDPILAYRKDDQYIGILDKGPLFLVYPFDGHPELQTMEYINRAIWQVNAIVLK
jgi:hypothetical protein